MVILMDLAIEDPRRLVTAASHLAGCTPIVHCFRVNVFLLLELAYYGDDVRVGNRQIQIMDIHFSSYAGYIIVRADLNLQSCQRNSPRALIAEARECSLISQPVNSSHPLLAPRTKHSPKTDKLPNTREPTQVRLQYHAAGKTTE